MSKSAMIRPGDGRALVTLIGECREMGDDWSSWWGHWSSGMMRLIDAELGLVGEVADTSKGHLRKLADPIITGREGFAFDPSAMMRIIDSVCIAPHASNLLVEYQGRLRQDDGVALTNRDFFSPREWQGSVDKATVCEAYGTDATLICCRRLDHLGVDESFNITFFRAKRRRQFSARDCTLIREALAATTPLGGGPLARYVDPSPSDLAPRVRQVLACFLQGDGDKQAALRLGISTHTVNQYSKVIFRHFRVRSRAELLARWIRRNSGSKLAWTDDIGSGHNSPGSKPHPTGAKRSALTQNSARLE